jgi:4-amino-4-deoxy-L-arabinose transferase-like glycosyltransferase
VRVTHVARDRRRAVVLELRILDGLPGAAETVEAETARGRRTRAIMTGTSYRGVRSFVQTGGTTGASRHAALLLFLAAAVILVGQIGRELLQPDDLREVEVAREMWAGGDVVVPHLAGLPFVEKPPGFPALVAASYAVAGGPSVVAARAVAAAFALASVAAVFLLGRRAMGTEAGALAAAALALSARFCRTAHEILLDDALTTTMAFALLAAWTAASTDDVRRKRRAYAMCGLVLGTSFLVKGFVGPVLFGAGALTWLLASRRWDELRHALRPAALVAFAGPPLLWLVPFLARATPDLVHAFFVDNYVGRATGRFPCHVRPAWFYAADLWPEFVPASVFLPFATWSAWCARRRTQGGGPGLFFLCFAAGPAAVLSLSAAKESVYLMPAFPALALLVAWWASPLLDSAATRVRAGVAAFATACLLAATAVVVWADLLGGPTPGVVAAAAAIGGLGGAAWFSWRRADLRETIVAAAAVCAVGWATWFTGALAAYEVSRRSLRRPSEALLRAAGDREVLLYSEGLRDGVRGGLAYYRNRTAPEVEDAAELVRRLLADPSSVALVRGRPCAPTPQSLVDAATALGARLEEVAHVPYASAERLTLFRAVTATPAAGDGR